MTMPGRLLALALFTSLALAPGSYGDAPRFAPAGVKLPGTQLAYDAGFEVTDWDGDGRPDLFLPNTSMMAFAVHLNRGTAAQPRFGHAVGYPVNLTETQPQTVEHSQAFALADLDGDGLPDLVVYDGELRFVKNTGTRRGPNHWHLAKVPGYFPGTQRMRDENRRFVTGPESMFWNKGVFARQVLTLAVADLDGDGLPDLLVSRFKGEAPGVHPTGGAEQWTGWGRVLVSRPSLPAPKLSQTFTGKLARVPERGLYFYRNAGTKTKPHFDKAVEVLAPDGKSIDAPNPVVFDVDGDGVLDIVSTETEYSCNAFRVDWPTRAAVTWFRRARKDEFGKAEAARPLLDASGKPVPAGVQARFADLGTGRRDLLVMDGGLKGRIRRYPDLAARGRPAFGPAQILGGSDFLRFDFMAQPVVVDWFGKGSRDLIVHGNTDAHCKFSLRRTALYRNVAKTPGEVAYEFAGWLRYKDDEAMVPPALEDRHYDVYGSYAALMPEAGDRKKRLLMSVSGKLYLFTDLAPDGLTFRSRKALDVPAERNRRRGWQDIAVKVPHKVKHVRIGNDGNGMGNYRDSFLHLVRFEAIAGGKNVASAAQGTTVADQNKVDSPHYRVQRPTLMLTPGNAARDDREGFTTFGYYIGPAVVTLKEPVALEQVRFLLSDREARWYSHRWPFYWQGKLLSEGLEQGEPWYQYKVEVSEDGKKWTTVADTLPTEMMRSCPFPVDWDGDGKVDLVLGVLNGRGIWPATKEYRLYRNTGTNDDPKFDKYEALCDDAGKPLQLQAFWYLAYGPQCGVSAIDLDGDGKRDLVVEGYGDGELLFYRNVTTDPTKPPRFKMVKALGDPAPIRYNSGYRYFFVGDVDGDGVPDLINSASASMAFFKGAAASAPPPVEDLAVTAATRDGLSLRWARPAGAARYDVRWSREPITELTWPRLSGTTGEYGQGKEATQEAKLAGLPEGAAVYVAVKSLDAKKQPSPLSNVAEAATAPLRRVVFRNGPAGSGGTVKYGGTDACTLDAQKPDLAVPRKPSALTARAQIERGEQQKVILVRFGDLPKEGTIARAVLELTTDPSLQPDASHLQSTATLAVSCSAVGDDWDAARATFKERAPGKAWQAGELVSGGDFQSMAEPVFTVTARRVLCWDVTGAAREAQKAGRKSLSLLVRVEYTGPYVAGHGYTFCGPEFPAVGQRPRLCLTVR